MENNTKEVTRRSFIKTTSMGAFGLGIGLSVLKSHNVYASTAISGGDLKMIQKEVRRDMFRVACSGALFNALNKHNGHPKKDEAIAVGTLSGGIIQEGYQCGMVWGSVLATGAEAYRRNPDPNIAIGKSLTVTKHLLKSFTKRAKHVNCSDITGVDWSHGMSIPKYMFTGKLFTCQNIAKDWAPEAMKISDEGFQSNKDDLPQEAVSCASEVARKMGADEEKIITVSGLAGGVGLSGNACGALAAAVWLRSLDWFRDHVDSKAKDMYNRYAKETLNAFYDETGSEILCSKICGKQFKTIGDHTTYVQTGGCAKLMNVLANS